jgi:hypothetical protein
MPAVSNTVPAPQAVPGTRITIGNATFDLHKET